MKKLLSLFLFLLVLSASAQKTDATLKTTAEGIRDATIPGSNTATKVGGMFVDLVNNKRNIIDVYSTSGTNAYTISTTPLVMTSYVSGQTLRVKFINANTGTCTINVNSIAPINLKKFVSGSKAVLTSSDIPAGKIFDISYDGTDFQIDIGSSISATGWLTTGTTSITGDVLVTDNGDGHDIQLQTAGDASIVANGTASLNAASIILNGAVQDINGVAISGSSTPDLTVIGSATVSGTNTGDRTIDELLPDQTGNANKFLKTNGTTSLWEDTPPGVRSLTGDGVDNTDVANPVLTFPTLTEILTVGTSAGSHKITNVTDPTSAQDAATKAYVDANIGGSASFQTLVDGPGSFTGKSLNYPRVNVGETLLEYRTPSQVRSDIGAGTGSGDALVANPLSQFASTTSAQLRSTLSDELGTGAALFDGATPTSLVGTNITGTAAGLTAGNVTTNANLTGDVTSSGNSTTLSSTTVTPGSYTNTNLTVDAKGRITAASNGSGGSGTVTSVTSANGNATVATTTTTPVITIVSAPKLETARTINGTSFDGTGNITVTADAGTLTGTTLNSTVVNSSLTSVATIGTGVWNGTAIGDTYISSALTWNAKESALTFSSPLSRSTNTISIPASSGSVNGYLSSTDWTTFNNKQSAITFGTGVSTWLATPSWTNFNSAITGTSPYWPLTGSATLTTPTLTGIPTIVGNIVVQTDNLGVTQVANSGIVLTNTTAAASSNQQISPAIRWLGNGWKTTATAGTQTVEFRADVLPIQGTTAPSGTWRLSSTVNGGVFGNTLTYSTGGTLSVPGFLAVANSSSSGATLLSVTKSALSFGVEQEGRTRWVGGGLTYTNVGFLDLSGSMTFTPSGASHGSIIKITQTANSSSNLSTDYLSGIRMAPTWALGVTSPIVIGWDYDPTFTGTAPTGRYGFLIRSTSDLNGIGTSAPISNLEVVGSFGMAITTVTTNTTLDVTYHTVLCDATGGNITITLPSASTATRREYIIKKIDASANTVAFSADGGTVTLSAQYAGKQIQSNGTSYYVTGSF